MSKKLILVRHCTTAWNRLNKVQGITDIDLDDGGIEEAKELTEFLRPLGIEIIYTSHLKRAVSTAKIVGKKLGIDIIVDERLGECNFGPIEGMTPEDAVKKYGVDVFKGVDGGQSDGITLKSLGGESRSEVLDRQLELLDEIKLQREEMILLIGHGRSLNTLYEHIDPKGAKKHIIRGEYRTVKY